MAKVKVMTYNLWFDDHRRAERIRDIIVIINKEAPDVVCLQEVIPETLQVLRDSLTNYLFTKKSLSQFYDTVILIKKEHEIIGGKIHQLPESIMRRNLELVLLTLSTGDVWVVGNFHLESIFGQQSNATEIKRNQFKFSLDKANELANLSGAKHVAIMGDTNLGFREYYKHNSQWNDCWEVAGKPKDHTYTNDGKRNDNLKHNYRNRMDRIIIDSNTTVVAASFRLIGTDQPNPSDHFGIVVELC